jgi:hypothetical protein
VGFRRWCILLGQVMIPSIDSLPLRPMLFTSWTSLLTPIHIIISTPLRGTEIDFSSEAFANDFVQLWNATTGIQNYSETPVHSRTCKIYFVPQSIPG